MAQCIKCSKKATVAVTRAMSIFPTSKRFYCDECKAKLDRKEDVVLVLTLTVTFLVVVGVIVFHHLTNVLQIDNQEAILTAQPVNMHSPESLQNVLTPAAWATYQRYGYPFDRVSTENTLGSTIVYKMTPESFQTLFDRESIRAAINFPDLMPTFIQHLQDPASGALLRLIFFTEDREIGFTVQSGTEDNPTYIALLELLSPEEFELLTNSDQVTVDKDRTLVPAELPEPEPVDPAADAQTPEPVEQQPESQ
ncbi:MAG: hypothetical protein P9M14_03535 [Candidatus Alcyoniella australis]|nr:hypothetical protein [Candidatus Alcyoniella australis]